MSDNTFIQIMGGAINALFLGGAGAALLPFLAKILYKRYEDAQNLRRDTDRMKEMEKQRTLELQVAFEEQKKKNSDQAIDANRAMVHVLNTAMNSAASDIKELQVSLRHTDAQLQLIASYMPYLEKFKAASDALEARKKQEREKFPEQEHIDDGTKHVIRTKKPEGAGG
jgi:hypothetical protein